VLCLRNLGLPLVHHEVVKQALVLALEHPAEKDPMLDLLSTLATQGHISETQLLKVPHPRPPRLAPFCSQSVCFLPC